MATSEATPWLMRLDVASQWSSRNTIEMISCSTAAGATMISSVRQ